MTRQDVQRRKTRQFKKHEFRRAIAEKCAFCRQISYNLDMPDHNVFISDNVRFAPKRRSVAIRLQEIEGNSLTPEDIALFDMFDSGGWSNERRLDYIRAKALPLAA